MREAASPMIWFLTQGYNVRGGHEAHVLHFATELRAHGFDTAIVVVDALPGRPHLFMTLLGDRKIPLISISDCLHGRVGLLALALFVPWYIRKRLKGETAQWSQLRRYLLERMGPRWLRKRIKADGPAVIHVHGRLPETFWPSLPLSRSVLHHGTEGRRDGTWDDSEADSFARFANTCARNFVPGQGVARNLCQAFGISADMQTVYTICPDQEGAAALSRQFSSRTGAETVFGILCRMTPEKGIDTLLQAIVKVRERLGDIRFVFAGSGVLDDHIAAFLDTQALSGVRVMSAFDSPLDVLGDLDIFVHPSISDAMPMALAEAMMCGRPCIATAVGGIPELLREGKEGAIVSAGDVDELAAAMVTFANMSLEKRRTFSEAARARYENVCTADRVGAELAGMYRGVIDTAEKSES